MSFNLRQPVIICYKSRSILLENIFDRSLSSRIIAQSYQQSRGRHNLPQRLQPEYLLDAVQQNISWVNGKYERLTGIDEIRKIQDKVLEADQKFREVAEKRRLCQDQIDAQILSLRSIMDRLESTPRESDRYIDLRTAEHNLQKELEELKFQLKQLKQKEQSSLDSFSILLRQNHELERLRQERSKYWQIISVTISLIGGVLALFTQKVYNTKYTTASVLNRLELLEMQVDDRFERLEKQVNSQINEKLDVIIARQQQQQKSQQAQNIRKPSGNGWMSYVPGLTTVSSWLGYFI